MFESLKMMAPDTVETARLRGQRLALLHWDIWQRMGADARIMATLGGFWTEAEAREKFEWNRTHWEQTGHCGIRKMIVNAKEEVELGYSVTPEFWGQGFATEMGFTALNVAFGQFEYPSVVAFTLVNNGPSERVMRKLGFSFEDHIIHAGQPHVLYRRHNPNTAINRRRERNPPDG